jgi:hypothetical protein
LEINVHFCSDNLQYSKKKQKWKQIANPDEWPESISRVTA